MKRKLFSPAFILVILITGCISSAHAAGPDGFANVPWGASKSQLDQVMAKQGFRFLGEIRGSDGSTGYRYYGTLAGTAGNFEFSFLGGSFFSGHFGFHNEDGGAAESRAYWQFLPLIQSKYGPPSETSNASFPYSGITAVWYGQAPGSSDKTQIVLANTSTSERCGRGYCTSSFDVIYVNQSLQQRLAGQRKDGL
jgi:hypothetical protein